MRSRSDAKRDKDRDDKYEKEKSKREWQIDVPNDPVNEQVVLAAMIVDDELRTRMAKLPPDAFYAPAHRAVFIGLQELVRQKLAYDPATVARLNPDADIRVLETLAVSRPEAPPNIDFHVDTLQWDHHRALVTDGPLASLIEAIQNPKETPDRVRALGRAVGEAFDQASGSAQFLRKPAEVVHEAMANVRKRVAGEAFFPYGIEGLDFDEKGARRSRPGAAPGMVTVLTGMSGAGKTTMAAHMILGIARQRRRVLVGAWEVRAPMTLELLATLSLKWSRSKVLDGQLSEEELAIFEQRMHEISKFVTFVENPFRRGSVRSEGRVTNQDYLDILEQHVEASGCDVALFDLFDRCLVDRRPDQEQEALWRVLEFTNDLQIHTVLVHQQLLKGDDVRADKRPSIAGLKGSSAYVDAGTAIIAPHLPARFKDVPDDTMEVLLLKLRWAAPCGVEFDWNPDTGQISGGRDMSLTQSGEGTGGQSEAFGIPSRGGNGKKSRR